MPRPTAREVMQHGTGGAVRRLAKVLADAERGGAVIVCIAPTPAVDRLHELSGPVVVGSIHRPHRVVAVAGGKGLNAARAAARLGAQVRAVVPLGGASGDWSKRSCKPPESTCDV